MSEPTQILLSEIQQVTVKPPPALVKAIKDKGIRVPVVLTPESGCVLGNHGDQYRILDGRRRVAAAAKLGLETVPAVVVEDGPELTIMLHATRSENPVAELQAIQELMRAGMSEEQIARAGYASIQRIRRIAKLNRLTPEMAERVNNAEIAPGVAFQIAMLPAENQAALAQEQKITAGKVRESRCVQREAALPGLEAILAAPFATAGIEEVFAELSPDTLYAILAEMPVDERFAIWRGKVQRVLDSRTVRVPFAEVESGRN